MAEPDNDLALAVEALRTKRSPPAGAQARVLARLEAQLGDGGPGGDGGLGQASGGGGAFAAKVVAATVAMSAGGLLIIKLGVVGLRALAPASASIHAVAEVEAAEESVLAEHTEPEPVVEAEPPENLDPPAAAPRTGRVAATKPARSEAAPAELDITAELALIEAARRAGSPRAAIIELEQHARQFPSGALRDEREALWAIASCELGELADVARRTRAIAVRRPNSPLLDRVAAACPELETIDTPRPR
jgi:hypothetical protein